ncbi:MAG: hypothetical protein JWO08_4571 [Verrucomicrobiaceae bacterium]|nr:hypothetical protein [Verrucomicrobiaceae bacterium]
MRAVATDSGTVERRAAKFTTGVMGIPVPLLWMVACSPTATATGPLQAMVQLTPSEETKVPPSPEVTMNSSPVQQAAVMA